MGNFGFISLFFFVALLTANASAQNATGIETNRGGVADTARLVSGVDPLIGSTPESTLPSRIIPK